ncbi:MAG: isoprenylcysteine carboxylmethyltransferase family protein, partial [Deltaproteobacteria bacterium]|nr:isoprenylcysteine carboxylmethyltransferase family protein [Deltaproteobacteria bacterium]
GPALLPTWLAVIVGLLLLSVRPLTTLHIIRSGFDSVGHGLGIYTVYPDEGTAVSAEIYSYIRHPMYLGSLCAAVAFASFRNNAEAVLVASLLSVPIVIEIGLEDREMMERCGEERREYIQRTGALFPKPGKAWGFVRLLLFLEDRGGQGNEM